MIADPSERGKRPYLAFTSLALFGSMFVTPVLGFAMTSHAIDNTPRDGQNYGLLFAALLGVVGVAVAVGVEGFVAMAAGGLSLLRGERCRWAALLGSIGGGLTFATVAGVAFTLSLA